MTSRKRQLGPAWRLAEAVEVRREELGLTWDALYERTGLQQSVVTRWKTNKRPPQLAVVGTRVAEFLGVPLARVRVLAGAAQEDGSELTEDEVERWIERLEGPAWRAAQNAVARRMMREDLARRER